MYVSNPELFCSATDTQESSTTITSTPEFKDVLMPSNPPLAFTFQHNSKCSFYMKYFTFLTYYAAFSSPTSPPPVRQSYPKIKLNPRFKTPSSHSSHLQTPDTQGVQAFTTTTQSTTLSPLELNVSPSAKAKDQTGLGSASPSASPNNVTSNQINGTIFPNTSTTPANSAHIVTPPYAPKLPTHKPTTIGPSQGGENPIPPNRSPSAATAPSEIINSPKSTAGTLITFAHFIKCVC